MLIVSCNEPDTIVTNYVHSDGSVTRKIIIHSIEGDIAKRFKTSDIQVPFDSTWTISDSCKVSEKGDTTWIRKAEKLFNSIDEINLTYNSDSGANKEVSRHAGFKKSFKWFNTKFRFSEIIDREMSYGYPIKDFLNKEELEYYYSPESIMLEKLSGPDSLKYEALGDTITQKTERWMAKSLVSEWIGEFARLTSEKTTNDMSFPSLKTREDEFVKIMENNEKDLDSLWKNGILLKEFIGEANALKYKTEADSSLEIITQYILMNFDDYSVRTVMPGKLIGTNGFIDSSQVLLWPVRSDYFLTEQYEMWAESKISNVWAWIVSAIFLIFVISGVIIRVIKRDS